MEKKNRRKTKQKTKSNAETKRPKERKEKRKLIKMVREKGNDCRSVRVFESFYRIDSLVLISTHFMHNAICPEIQG